MIENDKIQHKWQYFFDLFISIQCFPSLNQHFNGILIKKDQKSNIFCHRKLVENNQKLALSFYRNLILTSELESDGLWTTNSLLNLESEVANRLWMANQGCVNFINFIKLGR